MRGLAALALGDARKMREVMRRLARQGKDSAAYWSGRSEPTVHWQALTAELAGDFPAARRLLREVTRTGRDTRQARLHLEAVGRKRRRLAP